MEHRRQGIPTCDECATARLAAEAEWASWLTRLHADGPKGPACADVVRRFVAGEIEVTYREVSVEVE